MRGQLAARASTRPRAWADRFLDRFMYNIFPYPEKLRRWLWLARLGQAIGFNEFLHSSGLVEAAARPSWPRWRRCSRRTSRRCDPLPVHAKPAGRCGRGWRMFRGCVSESIFGPSNRAMWRVLLANDCEVFVPQGQTCCGAIHHHGGRLTTPRHMARRTSTRSSLGPDVDAFVTNVAGCGTMLKEYAELLHDDPVYAERARRFVAKMKDISEFLAALPLKPPTHPCRVKVTYHEACHLCHGQQIRQQPRTLLKSIPGLELVELPESDWCCGAAGTYNLTQPEMSTRLAERKLRQHRHDRCRHRRHRQRRLPHAAHAARASHRPARYGSCTRSICSTPRTAGRRPSKRW